MGHHFGLLRPVGYLAQSGPNLTFGLLKAHVLWARDIYTCKRPIFIEGPNYVLGVLKAHYGHMPTRKI